MRVSASPIRIALLAVLAGGGLGACRCQDESHEIHGIMPAVIERDGVPISTDLAGSLYVGNDNKTLPEYAPVVDFLTLSPTRAGAATWTLTASTGLEYLAVQLRGPRRTGEVVTVLGRSMARGGGGSRPTPDRRRRWAPEPGALSPARPPAPSRCWA